MPPAPPTLKSIHAQALRSAGVRVCTSCMMPKFVHEYGKNRHLVFGEAYACRGCVLHKDRKRVRVFKPSPPSKRVYLRSRLKRLYGMTVAQWDDLVIDQAGLCAICSTAMTDPNVDHCHDTGVVRGLLCGKCNRGLGLLGDTLESLRSAVRYLEGVVDSDHG